MLSLVSLVIATSFPSLKGETIAAGRALDGFGGNAIVKLVDCREVRVHGRTYIALAMNNRDDFAHHVGLKFTYDLNGRSFVSPLFQSSVLMPRSLKYYYLNVDYFPMQNLECGIEQVDGITQYPQ